MHNIVDYFSYFDPLDKEKLELRINILKDHVDRFVICEGNKTHSGIPVEYNLKNTIKNLNLPADQIDVLELDIADDDKLKVFDIDRHNCYESNKSNLNSVKARARERLLKDEISSVLDKFSDDTVFIIGDSDEIINPKYIKYFANIVRQNPNSLIKIPLVHLEGRADLRVYDVDTNLPKRWDLGMFMCTKQHLKKATVTNMRSNVFNPFNIAFITEGENRIEDVGWHFSWMGSNDSRDIKRKSFTHYDDKLSFLIGNDYKNEKIVDLMYEEPKAGNIACSGDSNSILKPYSINNLPMELLLLPRVKESFLPGHIYNDDYFDNEYLNACNTPTDIHEHLPILHELALSCNHITEMGVRTGVSTRAFLNTDVTLRSYDIVLDQGVISLFEIAKLHNKDVEYAQADTRELVINETDLLFIDTWHCYTQLKIELNRHAHNVKKYIAFHDTFTYGIIGENTDTDIGLLPALIEFMIEHPEWRFKIHKVNNNGLTVIERHA